jgi:hypothetical protein
MRSTAFLLACLLTATSSFAAGPSLQIELPPGANVKSATASAPSMKLNTAGKISSQSIVFENLLPDTRYDIRLDLSDGTVLQGVDLGWYDQEPAKKDAEAISDDDKKEIGTIIAGLQPFMNHNEILFLRGDHDRAVALCQFWRDKGFVNGKGGEIIWRAELWYFKYQAGGWEAVSQVNKILRRERFKTRKDYENVVEKLRWSPELGGIRLTTDQTKRTIQLSPEAMKNH